MEEKTTGKKASKKRRRNQGRKIRD